MTIVIAGGTGFLGQALVDLLVREGHTVSILTRTPGAPHHVAWNPDGGSGAWAAALDSIDAVINLAGAPIAEKRWTSARKQEIADSRMLATRSLAAAIRECRTPPPVLVSMSGSGYYGPHGDEIVTEDSPAGSDFFGDLCARWEEAAREAASSRTRVVLLRTGVVLAADGGAFPRMLLPFRLGVGGPVGTGRQYLPWIHRADWLAMVAWLLDTTGIDGPLNATAPTPVTSREFATTLGRVLHRPSFAPVPAFALKLMIGEMAGPLLLSGQRAVPARALELGFRFSFPELRGALEEIVGPPLR